MSTPESRVKVKVRALLKRYDTYCFAPVQTGMGAPTLDFIGCAYGKFFAIETKAPGKVPTPRQEITIWDMRAAGARVFVIDGEDGYNELEAWLRNASL